MAGRTEFNLRMPERLRAKIEADAEAQRMSMNANIVARLEATFNVEALFGGPRTAAVLRGLAAFTAQLGYDDTWVTDHQKYREVVDKWHDYLVAIGPVPPPSPEEAERRIALAEQFISKIENGRQEDEIQILSLLPMVFRYVEGIATPELLERIKRHLPKEENP